MDIKEISKTIDDLNEIITTLRAANQKLFLENIQLKDKIDFIKMRHRKRWESFNKCHRRLHHVQK